MASSMVELLLNKAQLDRQATGWPQLARCWRTNAQAAVDPTGRVCGLSFRQRAAEPSTALRTDHHAAMA